jgi:hypothetical protein
MDHSVVEEAHTFILYEAVAISVNRCDNLMPHYKSVTKNPQNFINPTNSVASNYLKKLKITINVPIL